jgi:hypothetical protein
MPSRGASPGQRIDPKKLQAYRNEWNKSDSGSETPPNSTSPQIHNPSGNASGPNSETPSAAVEKPSRSEAAIEPAEEVKNKGPGGKSAGQGSSGSSGRPIRAGLIPHVDDAGGGPLLPVPPKNPPARGYRPTPSQRISSGRTTNEKSPISGEGGANSSRSRTYKSEVASKFAGGRGNSTAWPEGSQKQIPENKQPDPTTQPETKHASQLDRLFEKRDMSNGYGKAVDTDDVSVEFVDEVDESLSGHK